MRVRSSPLFENHKDENIKMGISSIHKDGDFLNTY